MRSPNVVQNYYETTKRHFSRADKLFASFKIIEQMRNGL